MISYQRILDLCEQRGVKVTNVEKELGLSKGSLKKVEKNTPNAEKIYILAKYFGVPMEAFFEEEPPAISKYEEDIGNAVEYCHRYENDEAFRTQADAIEAELANAEPVYEVAAGAGRINGCYTDTYITEEYSDEFSWVQIYGDSMYPILHDGDLVQVHQQTETCKTDLTVIKVDGETATVKYVEMVENGIWLRAENKDVFDDKFYTVQEILTLPITIIGKVTELRRKLE